MNRVAVTLLTAALLGTSAAGQAATCGCSGASCSTSSTCADGCFAVCASGGCASGCAENQIAANSVNLTISGTSAPEISALVSQQLGRRFAFVPSDPKAPITVELKNMPATDLVKVFGAFGGAGLARSSEKAGPGSSRVDLRAKKITAAEVAQLLAAVAGDEIVFEPAQPEELVSLEVKNLSSKDLKRALTPYGKVELLSPTQ
jgi:hypothetical protein